MTTPAPKEGSMPTVDREGPEPLAIDRVAFKRALVCAICDGAFGKHHEAADAFMTGPVLAPILAQADTAAQAVADRDEAQRDYRNLLWEMERGGRVTSVYPQETYRQRVAEADLRFFAAQAEAARLSAEVEARDKRIAELSETWADEGGTVWSPPTAWAYAATCAALNKRSAEVERLGAALKPFAAAEAGSGTCWPDHAVICRGITFGHLRAARTALAAGQDKEGGKPAVPSTDAPAAAQEGSE